MKMLIVSVLLFSASGFPQKDPQNYIARIPSTPENACSMTKDQKSAYLLKADALYDELTSEIQKMRDDADKNAELLEDEVKSNYQKEYGLSDTDVKKLENDEMSEKEKEALVDKMMKQKGMDMTMEEMKKMKNMSKEERRAYADQKYKKEMSGMKGKTPDPQKTEENKKNMDNVNLAQEQKMLFEKISADNQKLADKLTELNKKDTLARREMDAKCLPLRKKLYSEEEDVDIIAIMREINSYEIKYCNELTPEFHGILKERLNDLKKMMPDLKRLEEVNTALNKAVMKTDKEIYAPGLMQLEAISDYLGLFKNLFKYSNYSFEGY
jgi:hypothetical protein